MGERVSYRLKMARYKFCLLTGILGESDHSTKLEPMYLLASLCRTQLRPCCCEQKSLAHSQ